MFPVMTTLVFPVGKINDSWAAPPSTQPGLKSVASSESVDVEIEPQHDEAIIDFWSFGLENLIQTKAKHHQASRLTILEL